MEKIDYGLLLSEPKYVKQEEYWLHQLSGELNATEFMPDFYRKREGKQEEIEFKISDDIWNDLAKISKKMDMSVYLILLTCLKSLIFIYTGNEDIAVVSPVFKANRTKQTLNQSIVIRNRVIADLTFKQLLLQIRETTLEGYNHQDFPFEKILENLKISQKTEHVFDIACLLKNIHDQAGLDQLQSNIAFAFEILEDSLQAAVVYNRGLYKESSIKQLWSHYICLLQQTLRNPQIKLSEIIILSAEEEQKILVDFNQTQIEYPKDYTLHQLFEQQVERTPDSIAIAFGEEQMTYQELNIRANQLATFLRERGIKSDQIVAIMVERSLEMMVGILGILKAGGAYLPISPDYPVDRIAYMLEDSSTEILLTHKGFADQIESSVEILDLEDDSLYMGDGVNLKLVNTSQDLAYVIYTSGSTGRPKGVMIEHAGVINRLNWMVKKYSFGSDDTILQKTPFTFDVSVWELFGWALAGAKLSLLIPGEEKDPSLLMEAIERQGVTRIHFVPSMLNLFLQHIEECQEYSRLSSLRQVFASGEALTLTQVERFNNLLHENNRTCLSNLYGPTEATVEVSYFECSTEEKLERVPIGKPIDNIQLYVVDKNKRLCPVGVPGELCIAGEGVARGYLNRPDLTAEKFVPNPFGSGKIYRTGDLTRWLPDGNIEFLGRIDFQVKIRGFRIELGEIENQILQHEAIKETVVVVKEDTSSLKNMCAYFVADQELTVAELRSHLAQQLPDYMIPVYFVQLDQIPLNHNGKVNRKALPEPTLNLKAKGEYVPPTNAIEEQLVAIWQEVLGVEGIGICHNFFEIGGHSLKAAEIVSMIHKELNVAVPLSFLFEHTSIKEVASCLAKTNESQYEPIQPILEEEHYPVSSAQRRLYVLEQLEDASIAYNMPGAILLTGKLDQTQLENAFKQLIGRHETLRTSFDRIEDQVVQKVHEDVNLEINYLQSDVEQVDELVEGFIKPFNLRVAPLLRVGLIQLAEDRQILLWDMHHIISDGVSMNLLISDFMAYYRGETLSELKVQYKDFSVWQNQLFTTGVMESQEKYWMDTFVGEIPILNLPTDYTRPAMQSFDGEILQFEADRLLTNRLNVLVKENGTSMYMILLAALNVLLAKYSGQEDIIVGSPIAGRSHTDVQNLIGMFVNTLAMRNYPEKDLTFKEFLKVVKKNALRAYENQDYQFEQLVNKLNVPRDFSRNPIFDIMFVLHNNDHVQFSIEGLQFEDYPLTNTMSKFDMTLNAEELDGQINFNLEYVTKLFKRDTMERFAKHYLNILRQIVTNQESQLAEIDLLLPEEKEKILFEFNNTKTDYPKEKTLHELFEEQALKTPEKVALFFREDELTYRELNEKANQLARVLREKDIKSDSKVAIFVQPSLEMMVAILAVLKSGGAYLPIDPVYPVERIKYVLEDSGAQMILTADKLTKIVADFDLEIIRLDEDEIFQGDSSNLALAVGSEDMAYMIYTSGSTGKPKGVVVEHRNVTNFIKGITEKIEFTAYESILTLTTCSFDIFGLESLLPLTQGLRLVIANDEEQKEIKALNIVMRKNDIDMLQMTPSRMRMLLNDEESLSSLKNVKVIMIGGEAFPPKLLEEIKGVTDAKIYNMYGPTETTIWSTVKDLSDTNDITIGQPIANTGIFILDSSNRLQPIGVPGELCIIGDGLARGYWNRAELTAEKFVSNPFQSEKNLPVNSKRMYRTGDLARWLPNGQIEFLGRIDHQVKIRGYRIELGEIESQLIKHESVKETVVIAKEDTSGGKYLCAYIVSDEELHLPGLKAHLGNELPDYMIPTFFIPIDQIPFTPNGKIDRKSLPEPNAGLVSGVEYVAPSTEIEEKLIQIWEESLGIEGIGVTHNFFDVGGNSINIIKVINLISKKMGVQVSMSELFLHPTVSEIAHRMFIENPLNGLECVVSLNKATEGKKNVFILHTWEGIIYQYKEIAKKLEGEYNIYGIQAKGVTKLAKLPETLEEMITDYICEIKAIQPEGPYTIAGYCYGNWIAYKMVEMLEEQDVQIDRMIQIDENSFLSDNIRKMMRVRTEVLRPYKFMRKWFRKLITRRNMNPMSMWPTLEEWNASKPPVEGEIKNDMTVRDNVNRLCTVGFQPLYIVRADTYIIKAEENEMVRYTPEDWERLVSGKVWFVEIPGGHESIFAYPYVDGLTDAFKRALEE